MASTSSSIVFDDIFTTDAIDKDGKKFDRANGDSFAMALASSLSRDGGAPTADGEDGEDKDRDVWRPDGKGRRGLEEDYDYVMYGKVYKFDTGSSDIVTAYASFGGLLLSITGSYRHLTNVVLGDPVYVLLRK
ncbi:RNA polymerase I [Suillus paluster]|uniref:RNA polymerase I n=1 Tax=Suillus paluster TaxID=48578 RepID=UPI001B85ECEC|nr:RNA polymerase I [Suillus paluster]KAG1753894.1 RNA polymerase I [Suillus paluster]